MATTMHPFAAADLLELETDASGVGAAQPTASSSTAAARPLSAWSRQGADPAEHRWAIVLAGGAGRRISGLTRDAEGRVVPKQYCSLTGSRSLLCDTLARAEHVVPARNVVTVVGQYHEPFWRRDLATRDPANVVVQPCDRGTAAGVLLPLLVILARDPSAVVTLLPSDHYVADEAALAHELAAAQAAVEHEPDRILLLGVEPQGPDADYGWIVPGRDFGASRAIRRFVEKPPVGDVPALMRAGAVWNSFLSVGSVWSFLLSFDRQLPGYMDAFLTAGAGRDLGCTSRLYQRIVAADFCRDVLEGSEEHLGLRIAPECGWTDLGTPTRLAACAEQMRANGTACRAGSLLAAVQDQDRAGGAMPPRGADRTR